MTEVINMKPAKFCAYMFVWTSSWAVVLPAQTANAFDDSGLARALADYVDDNGMVNYKGLKANPQDLNSYVRALSKLRRSDYDQWQDQAKIAFWLNAYNGLTLKAIINHYPIKSSFFKSKIYPKNSIRQISGVWDKITHKVMGKDLTLEHIEHKILRVKFDDPRIHMAMVCAAMSCPHLRNEPYEGSRLDAQLDDQSNRFLSSRARLKITRMGKVIHLSPIFKWFAQDFLSQYAPKQAIGKHSKENQAVLRFIAGYLKEPYQAFVLAGNYKIKYLDYDWSLNEQK